MSTMAFTAKDVKELREKTGCGMMDCKKALTASDGDMDKALDFLREKGLAAATKKAGRIAAEGVALRRRLRTARLALPLKSMQRLILSPRMLPLMNL